MTREGIYNLTKQCNERDFAKKLDIVERNIIKQRKFLDNQKQQFLRTFSRLKSEMKSKWQAANRTEKAFLEKNRNWLQGTVKITQKCMSNIGGRPESAFEDLSDCSKRRKTTLLRKENEAEALLFAGQMALRKSGNVSGAQVLKDIMSSPSRGNKYKKAFRKRDTVESEKLTPTQALSMFVEASLTRRQYEIIRESSRKLYPSYSLLQRAKQDCYPDSNAYQVTETCAEIKLQALADHTVKRFIIYLEEVLISLTQKELASLELTYKWGCDGSQQAQFKQTFSNNNDSDSNIFQSSLVPLQLICKTNKKIIWQNPTPSSPRFCRPMRIRFIRESKDVTNEEISYHKDQIKHLTTTKNNIGDKEVTVTHRMLFTMVDGKVCNAATNTGSSMRCYICTLTSKDFNDLEKCEKAPINSENLEFGLSILHARIRLFETLLHISYKITIKKWQTRTESEKNIIKERKQTIQERFRNELGLIVDVPKANYGNSNDGNTSRRFFSNVEISASITGIDQALIERVATILEVISSGHKIDINKFSEYCRDTAKLYIQLYYWYPMSPTLHKILLHGPIVIEQALLPIGALSEEAAESRNKHFRQYREKYARKFCRVQCNMDVINRLLLTSDPFLSCSRPKSIKKSKPFRPETIKMLLPWDAYDKDETSESDEQLDGNE